MQLIVGLAVVHLADHYDIDIGVRQVGPRSEGSEGLDLHLFAVS